MEWGRGEGIYPSGMRLTGRNDYKRFLINELRDHSHDLFMWDRYKRMYMPAAKRKNKKNPQVIESGTWNFSEGSYLDSTGKPLYALLFLLPLIVIYEIGVWSRIDIAHTKFVVTFTWLMGLAEGLGVDRSLAWAFPGIVVVIMLLSWHLSSQYPWQVNLKWVGAMAIESVLWSLPLFAMAAVTSSHLAGQGGGEFASGYSSNYMTNMITSIGAGIYEELIFRLVLIGLILIVMEDVFKIKFPFPGIVAVLVSAILFSVHHYFGLERGRICTLESFTLSSFIFRALAGIYFALIFRYRGYGITAGSHIAYDMIHYSLV